MKIDTRDLIEHFTRTSFIGHVYRVVFQRDLAACGSDAGDRFVVSLPPLLGEPFLPCPVVIDSPRVLDSLLMLVPHQGPTIEFSYDDTIQSLVFEFQNRGPVACPVWPQSEKEVAADAAWMQQVLGRYDNSRAVSLEYDVVDLIRSICLRFPGQMLRLQVDSSGAFLIPPKRGAARFLVPIGGENELDAEVDADRMVAALDYLGGAVDPRLVPGDPDGGICLTNGSAVYVVS